MQKEKILVIDDEEVILELSMDVLTERQYEVKTASNGSDGTRLFDREKFDLLLTDIRMPDIDGIDVIRHVRSHNKEIPIIVITAHGTLDVAVDALRLGAQGFLLKPFTPGELRSAVADAFGAMTTDRPYRKALSVHKAIEELSKYSGMQFDPDVVEIFVSILHEKGILKNKERGIRF